MKTKLSELTENKIARITNVYGGDNIKRRLLELGFVKGAIVKIENISPLGKSFLIRCQGSLLAMRLNAVSLIEVEEITVEHKIYV